VLSPDAIAAEVADRRARIAAVHAGEPSRPPLQASRPRSRTRRVGLSDQRLTRLLALPEWLATRPGVTVQEIATAFGCTVAEVEAELDLIDWLEIPKLGFVGELAIHDDGQISFTPALNAPRAQLTTVEAVHLLSLVEAAQALLPSHAIPALASVAQRLRAVLPAGAAIHQAELADHPLLAQLRDLVGTDVEVTFTYHGRRDDTATTRRCRPLQLQLIGGAVYLAGHDLDRDGERVFRLDRMSDLSVHPATPQPEVGPAASDPAYQPVDDEVEAELLLSPRAVWILTLIEPTATEPLPDGHVHAVVHTDAPDWLLAHVRAAGGEAELLRPAHLRASLQDP
jgi:proteasome accessory factor C